MTGKYFPPRCLAMLLAFMSAFLCLGAGASPAILGAEAGLHAGSLEVPVNKGQVLKVDRAFGQALIGNPAIADIMPLNERSLYVLGKATGPPASPSMIAAKP